ncbi:MULTISPECIES: cob(I)yrinic acid a,c-diamide adenosyltransferase [Lactobacillus]|uniref:Corrinoid adenosyltransferase n=1 Tax=Lactobacillus apis TaxID=303541 RepID=A0A0F4LUV8_9LACO|nr:MULTISPECIES: cob(I)yrinic acid a,c-diamide adenosyltransferase [Lactobacillus]KJY62537.1 ATP:cob(I)alamin adenosyltransferase [Lactobacillus apis]MCO6529600.1 cob(I)yrinic acid a,c-diamide adenosyltransferase [Lactobacillus sp.]MCT6821437.1 cob(I)yrinic acid a,c-diamide adenosyltransferase [Lactobacillus apis]MCT6877444.1 cob(I)yrinic acid a,c-diamide adenosyltransferase [Lactobacillus apis]
MTIKIYTKVGDQGYTKQVTGKMVPKYDLQIEALGDIDELDSYLGVVIANLSDQCQELLNPLQDRQRDLYELESDIVVKRHEEITAATVEFLEQQIDELNQKIPKTTHFILPGGSITATHLHYARTVARRAERAMAKLNDEQQELAPACLKYINRLSDYLFILARYANVLDGVEEVKSKIN